MEAGFLKEERPPSLVFCALMWHISYGNRCQKLRFEVLPPAPVPNSWSPADGIILRGVTDIRT